MSQNTNLIIDDFVARHNIKPLDAREMSVLQVHLQDRGINIVRYINSAFQGNSANADLVTRWVSAARVSIFLSSKGLVASFDSAVSMIKNQGIDAVRNAIIAITKGDLNARRVVEDWLKSGESIETPLSDGANHLPTQLPPPNDGTRRLAPVPAMPVRVNSVNNDAPIRPAIPGQSNQASPNHSNARTNSEQMSAQRGPLEQKQPVSVIYDQEIFYGRKAALKMEQTLLDHKSNTASPRNVTLMVVAAGAVDGQDAKKGLNWKDASVAIRLEPHELQLMLAVLKGFTPSATFSNHGPKNDKQLSIVEGTGNFAGTIMISVSQGYKDDNQIKYAVSISNTDLFRMMSYVSRIVIRQSGLDRHASTMDQMLKRTIQMRQLSEDAKSTQRSANGHR